MRSSISTNATVDPSTRGSCYHVPGISDDMACTEAAGVGYMGSLTAQTLLRAPSLPRVRCECFSTLSASACVLLDRDRLTTGSRDARSPTPRGRAE